MFTGFFVPSRLFEGKTKENGLSSPLNHGLENPCPCYFSPAARFRLISAAFLPISSTVLLFALAIAS